MNEVIVEALKTKFLLQEEEISQEKNLMCHYTEEIKKFFRMKSLKVKWNIYKMRM